MKKNPITKLSFGHLLNQLLGLINNEFLIVQHGSRTIIRVLTQTFKVTHSTNSLYKKQALCPAGAFPNISSNPALDVH